MLTYRKHCLFFLLTLTQFRKTFSLVWPEGSSKILIITGFGIPAEVSPQAVIFGTVIKGNYVLPMNATSYTSPITTYERRKRSPSRWNMYKTLSRLMEMRGFQGKACILQTICEIARNPLERNFGLFHELFHVFFTPSSTKERVEKHADNEYHAAQSLGKKNTDCGRAFADCATTFSDLFTMFF